MRKCKLKKCSECPTEFIPWNSTQVCCSPPCAIVRIKRKEETRIRSETTKADKVKRAETRHRKEKLKSRSDWLRDAQTVFNKFIRLRDELAGHGCISCTENLREIEGKGGVYDAGHYRSRGSAPELRFDEDNCFRQCKKCNRQLSGNVVEMRKGILNRIGYDRLQKVEGFHDPLKLSINEIKELKAKYAQKVRDLTR